MPRHAVPRTAASTKPHGGAGAGGAPRLRTQRQRQTLRSSACSRSLVGTVGHSAPLAAAMYRHCSVKKCIHLASCCRRKASRIAVSRGSLSRRGLGGCRMGRRRSVSRVGHLSIEVADRWRRTPCTRRVALCFAKASTTTHHCWLTWAFKCSAKGVQRGQQQQRGDRQHTTRQGAAGPLPGHNLRRATAAPSRAKEYVVAKPCQPSLLCAADASPAADPGFCHLLRTKQRQHAHDQRCGTRAKQQARF
jgi:hypothetical protein